MMSHNRRFKEGRRSEDLAKLILSGFSFVAKPTTVLDDLGSDFFCTLFKIGPNDSLLPQSSFAIQIKSKGIIESSKEGGKNKIDVTDKKGYLSSLEIPFFVGVVDKGNTKIEIYEGEAIDHFFARFGGEPEKVFIELVDNMNGKRFYEEEDGKYFMRFPKIVELSADFDYNKNSEILEGLFSVCSLIQRNISSRKIEEHIFERYGDNYVYIYTGQGSYKVFRENLWKRLGEVFYNFQWIYQNNLPFDKNEFKIYEDVYLRLKEHEQYKRLPDIPHKPYLYLKGVIDKKISIYF